MNFLEIDPVLECVHPLDYLCMCSPPIVCVRASVHQFESDLRPVIVSRLSLHLSPGLIDVIVIHRLEANHVNMGLLLILSRETQNVIVLQYRAKQVNMLNSFSLEANHVTT